MFINPSMGRSESSFLSESKLGLGWGAQGTTVKQVCRPRGTVLFRGAPLGIHAPPPVTLGVACDTKYARFLVSLPLLWRRDQRASPAAGRSPWRGSSCAIYASRTVSGPGNRCQKWGRPAPKTPPQMETHWLWAHGVRSVGSPLMAAVL